MTHIQPSMFDGYEAQVIDQYAEREYNEAVLAEFLEKLHALVREYGVQIEITEYATVWRGTYGLPLS